MRLHKCVHKWGYWVCFGFCVPIGACRCVNRAGRYSNTHLSHRGEDTPAHSDTTGLPVGLYPAHLSVPELVVPVALAPIQPPPRSFTLLMLPPRRGRHCHRRSAHRPDGSCARPPASAPPGCITMKKKPVSFIKPFLRGTFLLIMAKVSRWIRSSACASALWGKGNASAAANLNWDSKSPLFQM